jgi:hypothetical protein
MLSARRSTVAALALLAATLVGCSSSGSPEPSKTPRKAELPVGVAIASNEDRAAVQEKLVAYFKADTPEKVCATITRGLEAAIQGHGAAPNIPVEQAEAPSSPNCPNVISTAVKNNEFSLEPASPGFGNVLVQGQRAAVLATTNGKTEPYFLIHLPGGWRINDFGSPPPDFVKLNNALLPHNS